MSTKSGYLSSSGSQLLRVAELYPNHTHLTLPTSQNRFINRGSIVMPEAWERVGSLGLPTASRRNLRQQMADPFKHALRGAGVSGSKVNHIDGAERDQMIYLIWLYLLLQKYGNEFVYDINAISEDPFPSDYELMRYNERGQTETTGNTNEDTDARRLPGQPQTGLPAQGRGSLPAYSAGGSNIFKSPLALAAIGIFAAGGIAIMAARSSKNKK